MPSVGAMIKQRTRLAYNSWRPSAAQYSRLLGYSALCPPTPFMVTSLSQLQLVKVKLFKQIRIFFLKGVCRHNIN